MLEGQLSRRCGSSLGSPRSPSRRSSYPHIPATYQVYNEGQGLKVRPDQEAERKGNAGPLLFMSGLTTLRDSSIPPALASQKEETAKHRQEATSKLDPHGRQGACPGLVRTADTSVAHACCGLFADSSLKLSPPKATHPLSFGLMHVPNLLWFFAVMYLVVSVSRLCYNTSVRTFPGSLRSPLMVGGLRKCKDCMLNIPAFEFFIPAAQAATS